MAIVVSQPDMLWGTPVFEGTRIPAATLMDYLTEGDSLETFLEDFPDVTREQAEAFLKASAEGFIRTELKAA